MPCDPQPDPEMSRRNMFLISRRLAGFGRRIGLGWLLAMVFIGAPAGAGDYFTDVWTSENGLPDSSVTAVAQTPDGYLWVGTYNGLARFDGVRFVTFDPANTPQLLHARVRGLFVDRRGTLWINTYDGSLTTFRNGIFTLERRNPRPSEAETTLVSATTNDVIFLTSRGGVFYKSLAAPAETGWEDLTPTNRGLGALACADGTGALWYRDASARLWRMQDRHFELMPDTAGLAGQTINCLATDAHGRLWAGTDQGMVAWAGTRFQTMTPTNGGLTGNVTSLYFTSDDHIWALADGRMRAAAGRRWLPEMPALKTILSGDLSGLEAQADQRSGIWFFNYDGGLAHVGADGEAQQLASQAGFPKEFINCLVEDQEGNCWIGMRAVGLIRVRARRFQPVAEALEKAAGKVAKSVCVDRDRVLWVGTLGDGLERLADGRFTNMIIPAGAAIGSVFSVCPDPAGRLWASADDEDLFVREHGGFHLVSPPVQGVKALFTDSTGRIWAGTKSGLYYADSATPEHFHFFDGVPKHYVRALAEDRQGAVWAGTGKGELYCLVSNRATLFQPADVRDPGAIWSLLADPDGTIWAGTFRDGLLRFRGGKFTRYGKKAGLPDNVICQILDDGRGQLWLGSHRGIFSVAKTNLNDFAAGKSQFVPCVLYGRSDGLPSLECSGGYSPSAWRSQTDDRLWFTTTKGAVSIRPEEIRPNLTPPPVVIEEVLIDGRSQTNPMIGRADTYRRPAKAAPVLTVPPGRHQFEFRYTGLSLVAPERVRFRYQLEGADTDWIEAGQRRAVQYNLLPPGDYHFRVIACNSDGVWNETGSTIALKILPHFYETWWFRLLAALAIAGAVAGLARYSVTRKLHQKLEQLKRQRAVEQERTRIAKDLHDDLGSSLTLIAVLGDLAKTDKTGQRIDKLSGTARAAVKSLDEIVWAVNPGNDTLMHLIDYAGQFATDYLRAAGVRCLLDVSEQATRRELPANVRHNVFLVIKEALQNIVKHAHATEVWLRITASEPGLRVVIEDNGCGFDRRPADAWADGLRNMRQRLAEIGGSCAIQSHAGQGTSITIELPWPVS